MNFVYGLNMPELRSEVQTQEQIIDKYITLKMFFQML